MSANSPYTPRMVNAVATTIRIKKNDRARLLPIKLSLASSMQNGRF
jgi:hypothetical protein